MHAPALGYICTCVCCSPNEAAATMPTHQKCMWLWNYQLSHASPLAAPPTPHCDSCYHADRWAPWLGLHPCQQQLMTCRALQQELAIHMHSSSSVFRIDVCLWLCLRPARESQPGTCNSCAHCALIVLVPLHSPFMDHPFTPKATYRNSMT
jgi:hypothetical protein